MMVDQDWVVADVGEDLCDLSAVRMERSQSVSTQRLLCDVALRGPVAPVVGGGYALERLAITVHDQGLGGEFAFELPAQLSEPVMPCSHVGALGKSSQQGVGARGVSAHSHPFFQVNTASPVFVFDW